LRYHPRAVSAAHSSLGLPDLHGSSEKLGGSKDAETSFVWTLDEYPHPKTWIRVARFGRSCDSRQAQDTGLPDMKYKSTRTGISRQDLAQDRAFWRDLLAWRTSWRGLPAHSAGGYRNRRFAIIRDAVWITLYRAKLPFPQVGVFLRCAGLAGEAFFTLADRDRTEIEPRLRAEIGPDAAMEWGASHHPGMTDIAAILAAPLPWNDRAAGQHIAWMLRVGAAWWNCFASLAGGPEVQNSSPSKRQRRAPARTG
jgi:hypothetical protein